MFLLVTFLPCVLRQEEEWVQRQVSSHRSRGSLKGKEHCEEERATGLYKHTPLITGRNIRDGFLFDFVKVVLSL